MWSRRGQMYVAWLTLIMVALCWGHPAGAQPYGFMALDLPFPGHYGDFCAGINPRGVVVEGYVDVSGHDQGFVLIGSRFTLVPLLTPRGLNASRHVTGWYLNSTLFGFLYTNAEFLALSFPEATLTEAIGLNDDDAVVGDYKDRAGYFHPFLYDHGRYTTIDPPFRGSDSWGCSAEAINTAGVIVGNCGNHAYVDDHGVFANLLVPSSAYTFGHAINNQGSVAGTYYTDAETAHGFIAIDGGFIDISVPEAILTNILSLNDARQICGNYVDAQGVSHAFVGQPLSSPAQVAR
jgi:uncharacterized membrane protein